MTTTTTTKLLPFTITVDGSESLIMATSLEDAIARSESAAAANRAADPKFFARLFGSRPGHCELEASGLRQDLL